ncbi:MAG TPA: NFACT RNA binding domain-containing protein, partial [Terriglobia bacterium]|nr:NFACT RNA binding domain-containing protein [Terriglobia bacterium]
MDNLSLEVLVNEIKAHVLDTSIQRVKLAVDGALILALRSRVTEYLTISLKPGIPSLCILPEEIPFEALPSEPLLALRKYLIGGRIVGFRKSLADRVVFLEIENCRLSEQPERFGLVIELIPNRARACLLDSQQRVQVWLPAAHGLFGTYVPPVMPGCRVDSIQEEEFRVQFEQAGEGSGLSIFGLNSWFAREVLFQSQGDSGRAWQTLQALLQRVSSGPYSPRIYHVEQAPASSVEDPSRKPRTKQVIAPFALDCLGATRFQSFSSMNALSLELFHQSLERGARFKVSQSKRNNVLTEIRKKDRLKEKLQAQLEKAAEAQSLKTYADLLYAQHDKSAKGTALRVPNLFDPELVEVDIPLDPKLSLIENANRYHRLYRKAERSIPQITERLRALESEIIGLRLEEEEMVKVNSERPLPSDRLSPETVNKAQGDRARKPTVSGPRSPAEFRPSPETLVRRTAKVFRSSEGMQILVGKSSKDNDVLTLKVARNEDFWLHVAGYGGSHVVLRNPEKLPAAPKQSLLEA